MSRPDDESVELFGGRGNIVVDNNFKATVRLTNGRHVARNVGRIFGDVIAENDWKVWDDAIMRDKFDKSIDKAAEWMFPIQELIPNN